MYHFLLFQTQSVFHIHTERRKGKESQRGWQEGAMSWQKAYVNGIQTMYPENPGRQLPG